MEFEQKISVWSVPILITFWNELMWKFEKNESEDLLLILGFVEQELRRREVKT